MKGYTEEQRVALVVGFLVTALTVWSFVSLILFEIGLNEMQAFLAPPAILGLAATIYVDVLLARWAAYFVAAKIKGWE